MLAIIWYDDSKKTVEQKIREGCARYQERYDVAPDTVLVNKDQIVAVQGVTVRDETRIRLNNFQIGIEGAS